MKYMYNKKIKYKRKKTNKLHDFTTETKLKLNIE